MLSESAVESWPVQAQLVSPIILLLGPMLRSSSISTIVVGFTPVQDALTVEIEAMGPPGFDFSRATVERPFELPDPDIRAQLKDSVFVINNCEITRFEHWNVTISYVKLGRLG